MTTKPLPTHHTDPYSAATLRNPEVTITPTYPRNPPPHPLHLHRTVPPLRMKLCRHSLVKYAPKSPQLKAINSFEEHQSNQKNWKSPHSSLKLAPYPLAPRLASTAEPLPLMIPPSRLSPPWEWKFTCVTRSRPSLR